MEEPKSSAPISSEQEAISLVRMLHSIELPKFRVVGGIVRYDDFARNILKDTKQRVVTSLTSQVRGRDNYLIWAPPGSGKSFFIQEIAKSLGPKIDYIELNLAQLDEQKFRTELSKIERANKPRLCFIDEVDSKSSEMWPYEALLPSLEPSDRNTLRTCFILAGSGGNSLSEMKERIAKRPKGVDLLSRIPTRNESSIPGLTLGDRLLVASTQFLRASSEKGRQTDEVEKLVLYYIALNPKLNSARQIRDLTIRCVERMPSGEERVKFDYLFDAGDPENKEFWHRAGSLRNEFVNTFVRIEDDQIVVKPSQVVEEIVLDKHRIAVLPFANISPDPADAYFADGITEELISTISKIGQLQVIARTSVIRYKEEKKSATEIGHELKVGCLLEGSVRKAGEKLRITAQLIDSQTSAHLWSDTYDREMKDVFAIQSDVAERVAGALQVQLLSSVRKRIEKEPTTSQEAHSLYLKGVQYFYEQTEEGFEKALKYFELAVLADPNYSRPYVATFFAYLLQVIAGYVRLDEVMEKALAAAFRAIELDKDSAEAHLALAAIKMSQLDWTGAEEEARIAVELDPSFAEGHLFHGQSLFNLRRREEALAEMRKLVELDPLSSNANGLVGWMLFENKLFDESINVLKKTVEMDPYLHSSHSWLGTAYLEASRFDEAILEFQEAMKLSGGKELRYIGLLGEAYARNGNVEETRKIIESLEESSKERPIAGTITAVYLALGDLENTFLWADRAIEEHNPGFLSALNTAYEWDSVRSDPRFIALLKKAGIS